MKVTKVSWLALSALVLGVQPASAEMPKGKPFSMRGVELGITLDAFRAVPMPDAENHEKLQTWCSSDQDAGAQYVSVTYGDEGMGIIACQWFSADTGPLGGILRRHWVLVGTGGGWPLFEFLPTANGLRLFRISFRSNNDQHPGINDALTRGYGPAKVKIEPFKTKIGAEFTSINSVWDNGLSKITLIERCREINRYCMTYEHTELMKAYSAIKGKKAAEAAGKL